jgi:GTP pyrophosphokinase
MATAESHALGKELLEREIKKLRLTPPVSVRLEKVAEDLGCGDSAALYSALGHGTVSLTQVMPRLYPQASRRKRVPRGAAAHRRPQGIRVQGLDNMMFRFGQCCHPVPGDTIIGFITRGRGITIHRRDCPSAEQDRDERDRRVEVEWDVATGQAFVVKLILFVQERRNLLRDVTNAIADAEANVRGTDLDGASAGTASVVVEVADLDHLNRVMQAIEHVKGVVAIERSRGAD